MKSFQDFWTFLETSHPQWWDFTKMRFGNSKDIRQCAMDCWAYILADEKLLKMEPASMRKYFVSWLMKAPNAPVKIDMAPPEKFKESENFLVGEERNKRLEEFKAAVLATPALKPTPRMTRKEFEENGGWTPKKEAPYPSTSENEVKAHEKHLRYLKANYDARTREKLPEWMEELLWNQLND